MLWLISFKLLESPAFPPSCKKLETILLTSGNTEMKERSGGDKLELQKDF